MAEQQAQPKSNEDKNWYQRNSVAIWSTVIGIAALFSPMLLSMPAQFGIAFTTKTGAAGDTFGGFANPFISILVAYLTYQAFMQQKLANKQQIERLEEAASKNDRLERLREIRALKADLDNKISYLRSIISDIKYTDTKKDKLVYGGTEAIKEHLKKTSTKLKSLPSSTHGRASFLNIETLHHDKDTYRNFIHNSPLTDGVFASIVNVCVVFNRVILELESGRDLLEDEAIIDYQFNLRIIYLSNLKETCELVYKIKLDPEIGTYEREAISIILKSKENFETILNQSK